MNELQTISHCGDGHFPTISGHPNEKVQCLVCGEELPSVWSAEKGCWVTTAEVLPWYSNRGFGAPKGGL